jgi:hypothetical protein
MSRLARRLECRPDCPCPSRSLLSSGVAATVYEVCSLVDGTAGRSSRPSLPLNARACAERGVRWYEPSDPLLEPSALSALDAPKCLCDRGVWSGASPRADPCRPRAVSFGLRVDLGDATRPALARRVPRCCPADSSRFALVAGESVAEFPKHLSKPALAPAPTLSLTVSPCADPLPPGPWPLSPCCSPSRMGSSCCSCASPSASGVSGMFSKPSSSGHPPSTTSALFPRPPRRRCIGTMKMNVDPSPGPAETTSIEPPCSITYPFDMARPSPLPPWSPARSSPVSSCTPVWKRSFWSSWPIPTPVSVTATTRYPVANSGFLVRVDESFPLTDAAAAPAAGTPTSPAIPALPLPPATPSLALPPTPPLTPRPGREMWGAAPLDAAPTLLWLDRRSLVIRRRRGRLLLDMPCSAFVRPRRCVEARW